MISADDVIVSLTTAAAEAQAREEAFRSEAAATAKRLETDRATAFRRLNFMRALAQSATAADSAEAAAAAAQAHVRTAFGWDSDSEARTSVLERIAPVGAALFAVTRIAERETNAAEGAIQPAADGEGDLIGLADPAAALSAFENWYEQTRASSFWFLFEHYMPETPRVDY